ncbi:MAG: DnaJ domain-containing protein [Raoultibacter sp.]
MKKSEALKILGLSDGANDDAVKRAHREKVRENHPDNFAQNSTKHAEAEEKTKLINESRDVLLSRKWDPEYGGRRPAGQNPYGGSYPNPYGGGGTPRPGAGGEDYDPFAGWPFGGTGQTGWVWTSWDDTRQAGAGQPGQQSTYNPFSGAGVPHKTPQERFTEAEVALKVDAFLIAAKLIFLAAMIALGSAATGLFAYVLVSVVNHFRRSGGCSWVLMIPALLIFGPWLIMLMPRMGSSVTIGLGIFFALAVFFDLSNTRDDYRIYQAAKKAVG